MESVDEDVLVAAAALLLLASLPDRTPAAEDLLREPNPPPSTEAVAAEAMSIEMTPSVFLPIWGIRSRRSRCVCKSKREREEDESSVAAAAAAVACNRQSPATPHDFATVSDPSTSDSDGLPNSCEKAPVKSLLSGDTSALSCGVYKKFQVSEVERSPLVEAVDTSSRLIRNRRHGRKKTLTELQSHERLLMEEKTVLVKLVESKRKEVEALNAENQRLKRMRGARRCPRDRQAVSPSGSTAMTHGLRAVPPSGSAAMPQGSRALPPPRRVAMTQGLRVVPPPGCATMPSEDQAVPPPRDRARRCL